MNSRKHLSLLVVALMAAVVGAGTALYLRPTATSLDLVRDRDGPAIQGLLWPNPKQVAPFELTDHHGQAFDLDRLKGRWSFMFFGYTHCPDICPMTMDTLKRVADKLEERQTGADTQVVFVSVDPARDSPEHLKNYVEYFNPDFVGATGATEELMSMTRQLGIIYDLHEADQDGNYLVDHSAAVLLTDPQGRLVGVFSAPHRAEDMTARFEAMRGFLDEQS
ncbi:MAG: SCO family protein [Gammaproteobacteria bacterium]|nr:SCO family protein [Gammaproteobacteria bacterium]